jgi:hypothetical protein
MIRCSVTVHADMSGRLPAWYVSDCHADRHVVSCEIISSVTRIYSDLDLETSGCAVVYGLAKLMLVYHPEF